MAALSFSPQTPLTVVRAWTCLGINVLATPGLGSVMGGRRLAGKVQLYFSVTGFFLIVIWMFKFYINIALSQISETPPPPVPAWWWQLGVGLFGIAWLWSLVTSISLVLQARRGAADDRGRAGRSLIPPRLSNPPEPAQDASRPAPPKLEDLRQERINITSSSSLQPLDAQQIEAALATMPEWEPTPGAIARTFQFEDFPTAIAFVDQVAKLAEAAGHHPDIDIRWNKVTLTLTTHDAGGLTEKDFALARQFDRVAAY
jgi:4a-hydroxytetrahydrobiopterin dehydratase